MKLSAVLSLTILFVFNQIASNAQAINNTGACTIGCPSNMIIKAETGKEGASVTFPLATSFGDCGTISYSPASGSFFRLGSHSIIATSSSGQKCSFTITVTDNQPPSLSPITLSRDKLWPVSNKLKKVGVYYNTSDNAQDVKTEISVSSNATDGNKDWEIVDDHLVRLIASRLPDGSPRIYIITVTATDESGNRTTRTTSIAVSNTMTAIAAR
ncbi:MAG TPA: HYR domain-containing protein [Chitinophagaceae bacterium]|nr:HYR domain-containing protein [Chitinophagaceae bacterium]